MLLDRLVDASSEEMILEMDYDDSWLLIRYQAN